MDSEGTHPLERHRLEAEPVSEPVRQSVDYGGQYQQGDYFLMQLFMDDDLSIEQSKRCDKDGNGEWDCVQQRGLRALITLSLEASAALDERACHIANHTSQTQRESHCKGSTPLATKPEPIIRPGQ